MTFHLPVLHQVQEEKNSVFAGAAMAAYGVADTQAGTVRMLKLGSPSHVYCLVPSEPDPAQTRYQVRRLKTRLQVLDLSLPKRNPTTV